MPLTHFALLNAQLRNKPYRPLDGHGLYLQVAPSGGKWWRVKYRLGGREQCLSVGTFPAVALKAARQRCEELRAKLASGVDPAAERRSAKQQLRMKDESFEVIAREWYATFSRNWAPTHGDRVLRRLETYVFPWVPWGWQNADPGGHGHERSGVPATTRASEHPRDCAPGSSLLQSHAAVRDHYRPSGDGRPQSPARRTGAAEDSTSGLGQRPETSRGALKGHRRLRRETRYEVRVAVCTTGVRPPRRAPPRSVERFRLPAARMADPGGPNEGTPAAHRAVVLAGDGTAARVAAFNRRESLTLPG